MRFQNHQSPPRNRHFQQKQGEKKNKKTKPQTNRLTQLYPSLPLTSFCHRQNLKIKRKEKKPNREICSEAEECKKNVNLNTTYKCVASQNHFLRISIETKTHCLEAIFYTAEKNTTTKKSNNKGHQKTATKKKTWSPATNPFQKQETGYRKFLKSFR